MSRKRLDVLASGFLVLLVVFPFLPGADRLLRSANEAATFTIVAASLVMLTGWVGQISLGHAALVGIGAYSTGFAVGGLGLGFPLSLPIALVASGAIAALLGLVALRVRGLYLAVATLIFSWAASEYLFRQGWLLDHSSIPRQTIGTEGTLLYLDFGSQLTFYFVAWAAAVAVLFGLLNLRDSKTGRAFFAVRGSEMAAASLGMNVLRYKALAFALSGMLAGLAGNLLMTNAGVVSADTFDFNRSLFFLAIAVVGGLGSLPGTVAASLLFAAMSEMFFRVAFLNAFLQLVSAGLLALVFRVYPGGLAAMARTLVEAVKRAAARVRRLPQVAQAAVARLQARAAEDGGEGAAAPGPRVVRDEEEDDEYEPSWLARGLRQAFGRVGRVAVVGAARAAALLPTGGRGEAHDPSLGFGLLDGEEQPPDGSATAELDAAAGGAVLSPNGQRAAPDATGAGAPTPIASVHELPAREPAPRPATRRETRTLMTAENIVVRFGGLTAVDDASLEMREGEIVGLIGPNGAGKTTLFNSIAGFNRPNEGRVRLYGQDVTDLGIHERAALGLSRTFQLIQLFPQLSVFDNLLAATHLQNTTGFLQHMAVTPAAMWAEASARQRVERVIDLLDLDEVAHAQVANIPFGTLRMVEVARALVTGARVMMLDEPASGLDERETDRLSEVLRFVRDLGATLLLIEHDVRMVTGVSDYIYVLNRGRMIADGPPQQIQEDPAVISAYLGAAPAKEEVVT